jgi:hypothetical protein
MYLDTRDLSINGDRQIEGGLVGRRVEQKVLIVSLVDSSNKNT